MLVWKRNLEEMVASNFPCRKDLGFSKILQRFLYLHQPFKWLQEPENNFDCVVIQGVIKDNKCALVKN